MSDDPSGPSAELQLPDGAGIGSEDRRRAEPRLPLPAEPELVRTELRDGSLRLSRRRRWTAQESQSPVAQQAREAARLIGAAWGDRYVEELLLVTVPALLAPGNVPALAEYFDVELVLVTEIRLFELVARRPVILALLEHCDVRLVPVDDLLSPWYGITLTFALLRGFADLGADMVGAHLLFINTDFVVADGSYRNLAKMILRGERVIVSPSHCMVYEDTIDLLRARCDQATGSLTIDHRALAAMILRYRHNTVRAKTANQQLFRLHWHDQFYWYVDDQTMLARQLPIAVVYMRPERVVTELPTFWDYGMLSEICPTARPCVLGDSDEFLMAEMRGRDTLSSHLRFGWPSVDELAADLSLYLTKDHHDYGQHTLVLHSADLPERLAGEQGQFDAFMAKLYGRLAPPRSYRDHPFWLEGWDRFQVMRAEAGVALRRRLQANAALRQSPTYARRAERLAMLRVQAAQVEKQAALKAATLRREEEKLRELLRNIESAGDTQRKPLQEARQALQREIADLERLQQQELDSATLAETPAFDPEPSAPMRGSPDGVALAATERPGSPLALRANSAASAREQMGQDPRGTNLPSMASALARAATAGMRGWAARVRQTIFGRLPHTTPWHSYHTSLRHVRAALAAAVEDGATTMLFIASEDPLAPLLVSELSVRKTVVTPRTLSREALDNLGGDVGMFDCCFCYLTFSELPQFREMLDTLRPALRPESRVVLFYHNREFHALDEHIFAFTTSLFPIIGASRISFTGSLPAAFALRWSVRLLARRRASRLFNLLSQAAALLVSAPLARLGAAVERNQDPRRYPKHCTGMTIEIDLT